MSQIHDAAQDGALDKVRALLKNNPEVISSTDASGNSPLHTASSNGQIEVTEYLLANNADIEAKSNIGNTPLHLAAFAGRVEIVKVLLTHGANVNSTTNEGWTPLRWAMTRRNKEVSDLLMANGAHADIIKPAVVVSPARSTCFSGTKPESATTALQEVPLVSVGNRVTPRNFLHQVRRALRTGVFYIIICSVCIIGLYLWSSERAKSRRITCRNNLRRLSYALELYAAANNGKFPPTWRAASTEIEKPVKLHYVAGIENSPLSEIALSVQRPDGSTGKSFLQFDEKGVHFEGSVLSLDEDKSKGLFVNASATPAILVCPGDNTHFAAKSWEEWTPSNSSYEYFGQDVSFVQHDNGPVPVICICRIYSFVILADGSVTSYETHPEWLQQRHGNFYFSRETNAFSNALSSDDKAELLRQTEVVQVAAERWDFDAIAKHQHPAVLKLPSKDADELQGHAALAHLEESRVKHATVELGEPSILYHTGREILCFVPRTSLFEVEGTRFRSEGYWIAIQLIGDNEWKFIDGAGVEKNREILWKMFPELQRDVRFPECKQVVVH